jgi:hypothetical protein
MEMRAAAQRLRCRRRNPLERVAIARPSSVDARWPCVYDEMASGRLGDRGLRVQEVEESPYSRGHGAGEIPGRSDLSERATEKDSRARGLPRSR